MLDAIRFQPEGDLLAELFERYGLEEILSHYETSGGPRSIHDYILGTHLRLTKVLSPRLWSLFDEVRSLIGFDDEVELFVSGNSDINAYAMNSPDPERPHIIALTSGAVERMSDDELSFVIGHEFGHLHYSHYRANLITKALEDERGESTMPALLARRMSSWDRLAELSADRAGFLASKNKLETAVSVFFKLTAGLGPDHLRFDIEAFLGQLNELQDMKRSDLLAWFSHPVTPVRVRALQLFSEAGGASLPSEERPELDAQVSDLAKLMDLEVTKPSQLHARNFLLSGGLLAALADGTEMTGDQHALLVDAMLPVCSDPELELSNIESGEQARAMLEEACDWLREHSGEERYQLFELLAHLVAIDGELHEKERGFLLEVAGLLRVPEKSATDTMYEVLQSYLQQRAARARPSFAGLLTTLPGTRPTP